ncbi:multifunctional oxoglutarate decarboxylase/oxoglutarate dehydrogenase thiamine pyrophosphate-binding subunit/dihydrolipoyllysine-residue succinyltransferase subunit [Acidipropionibacterium jensenii]
MREQFQRDPDSVGPEWVTFFQAEERTSAPRSPETPRAPESAAPAPREADPVPQPDPTATTTPPQPRRAQREEPSAPPAEPAPRASAAPSPAPSAPSPAPSTPAGAPHRAPVSADQPVHEPPAAAPAEPRTERLRGAPMRTAKNMETSLSMPTATSVRDIPMKLVIENRLMINRFLSQNKGGKVSFTHILGFAMVRALKDVPAMNNAYAEIDGKPHIIENPSVNLGLAIDVVGADGTRKLVVPAIRAAEAMDFSQFWAAYEQIVAKGRKNTLTVEDFKGVTASLTNPGGIGTNHSVPRLMPGQGMILGMGSIDYPAGWQGGSPTRLAELGISKVTTLTSTYDHRIIQGAQSGEFLRRIHKLLLGADRFYEEIFESLRIPYAPVQWAPDRMASRPDQVSKQVRVITLIDAWRQFGHMSADLDPLEYKPRYHHDLMLNSHGLTLWDLDRSFPVNNFGGMKRANLTLREILEILRDSYASTMGIEYMHITDHEQRRWFQDRFERVHTPLSRDVHLRILDQLTDAEVFETFLQTKYVGQKRFSLEGGESAIVLLAAIFTQAADQGLDEVCIGMPHRGRLNVLANIIGKSYGQIFREFEGNAEPSNSQGSGDVKYHLSDEGRFTAPSGHSIKASVAANPSHLEAVDPVLEGICRAKLDVLADSSHFPVLPVLMHGDAAFAGQGVVFETLQMSQLRPYRTGGTIHVVVNNQVGFTTSPAEGRTSQYATGVAKSIAAPVIHVNGDDPAAVVRAAHIAFAYRQTFHGDVVIDLVCYRRRGHNEGDDPSFTQPHMYDLITQKRSTRKVYTESLIGRGDITLEDADAAMTSFRRKLETAFEEVRNATSKAQPYDSVPDYPRKKNKDRPTAISAEMMDRVATAQEVLPASFTPHPKIAPQLARRARALRGQGPIDWASAEMLALGSLVAEGLHVRLTGQDSRRGTFSQRFGAIVDRATNKHYVPVNHIPGTRSHLDIYDSPLNEYASLGFEYGYSVARPDSLVLWEAQFGDFANVAQTIIDEFIASAGSKWGQKSGVVLLLPHGYEGQGPDHSSARLERFLSLCSEEAMAVCQPSTAASYFHLLRYHAYVNLHRPVVIATPKSMLRNKAAASTVEDFTEGHWRPVISDESISDPSGVRQVILCTGKVRWELVRRREQAHLTEKVAIISMERLYPLPTRQLVEALAPYRHVDDVRWVQEEPANQGPWPFMQAHLREAVSSLEPGLLDTLTVVARPPSAASSVGQHSVHMAEEEDLLTAALAQP